MNIYADNDTKASKTYRHTRRHQMDNHKERRVDIYKDNKSKASEDLFIKQLTQIIRLLCNFKCSNILIRFPMSAIHLVQDSIQPLLKALDYKNSYLN